jgi:hypothetical protein
MYLPICPYTEKTTRSTVKHQYLYRITPRAFIAGLDTFVAGLLTFVAGLKMKTFIERLMPLDSGRCRK